MTHSPTDSEINRLCAEACGYKLLIPRYCENPTELHDLIRLAAAASERSFGFHICGLADIPVYGYVDIWAPLILLLPPRKVCIAALKALDKWPEDWSSE